VSGVGRLNADFTAITLPNGTRRAYFVDMTPGTSVKTVSSAQCATAECLSVGTSTPIAADVAVPMTEKAWGVPDAVVTPDGKVRVYLVVSPTLTNSCPEKVRSYISSDGINFTAESGYRLEGGFVDTEILRAKTGDWLMIMSTGPGCGNGMQQLFVSSSADGLTWSTPQAGLRSIAKRISYLLRIQRLQNRRDVHPEAWNIEGCVCCDCAWNSCHHDNCQNRRFVH
jgi:hypothetical protein